MLSSFTFVCHCRRPQVSHHVQCNDEALDEDVFSAFPALRFDARLPRRPWHRWQHIYMVSTHSESLDDGCLFVAGRLGSRGSTGAARPAASSFFFRTTHVWLGACAPVANGCCGACSGAQSQAQAAYGIQYCAVTPMSSRNNMPDQVSEFPWCAAVVDVPAAAAGVPGGRPSGPAGQPHRRRHAARRGPLRKGACPPACPATSILRCPAAVAT